MLGCKSVVPWIGGTRILVGLGETGLTCNVYCGLHEFEFMSFAIHFLRDTDTFVDVGANSGSYTILAAGVAGCKVIAIEPVPYAYERLIDNVQLNRLASKVTCLNIGAGALEEELNFSIDQDTMNHVIGEQEKTANQATVCIKPLDSIVPLDGNILLKIDVEGYESKVIDGAEKVLRSNVVAAVIMELNGSGARYGFNDYDLHLRMKRLGYIACIYSPFERTITEIQSIDKSMGNTIYIKNPSVVRGRLTSAAKFQVFAKSI